MGSQRWVIVITSKDLTEEDRRRLQGGVNEILQKGAYRMEELLGEIRRLVQGNLLGGSASPAPARRA